MLFLEEAPTVYSALITVAEYRHIDLFMPPCVCSVQKRRGYSGASYIGLLFPKLRIELLLVY